MIYLHFKWGGGYSKSEVDTLLTGKADTSHTHTKSQITDFPSYGTTANTICEGNDSRLSDARTPTSHTHTKSEITDFPTIPTVNNATLTIQKNGTTVKTFTANASSDVTCNITVPTKTSELTNDSGFLTSADLLPIGSYIQFAGSQAPEGFLVCNGGAISRTTYSALFDVIGTTYGSGDGSTTFNLPNLTNRFLQGSSTSGTVKNAGLPNITGGVTFHGSGTCTNLQFATGSFVGVSVRNQYYGGTQAGGAQSYDGFRFYASLSSSIYGNSTTVQPPALTCLICIKY